jgi:hypothetical protein
MSVLDAIGGLIDSAKRLRSLADELQSVELKSRIVDEIVRLQEIREQTFNDGISGNGEPADPTSDGAKIEKALLPDDESTKFARLEPSADGETYSLTPEEDQSLTEPDSEEEAAASLLADEESAEASASSSDTELGFSSTSDTEQIPSSDVQLQDLTEEKRFSIAQARIAELESLHQAALRKMNDVLNDEQKARKTSATKKHRKAGLKGKELQAAVRNALGLTDEQQQQLSLARREVVHVRQAIAHQVEGLLSKEQLDKMLRSHRSA